MAHDLVRKIAGVGDAMLGELQAALDDKKEGFAEAIIERINRRLEAALNLSAAWAQDQEFKLEVSARSKELVFSVRDRTNTKYAFDERSDGLRYFLSYYVQYLAYEPPAEGERQILLMDEPDTYLSSRGQQDLLRVFQQLARPEPKEPARVQVVYVTHSPFLLDKNHAERIRVLQKGRIDEGTRVVLDVGRNHYEPLRSAFGAFVAETAFIGNCNIMVEGQSDQILLAGATRYLRAQDVPKDETLNLNEVTLVTCGGSANVPYLTFVARGRDADKPAIVVLLDSDKDGNTAKEVLLKGVWLKRKRKKMLKEEYIVQIGEALPGSKYIEDLIPLELAVDATNRYLQEYCASESGSAPNVKLEDIKMKTGQNPLSAIQQHLETLTPAAHMEKVGFALKVVEVVQKAGPNPAKAVQEFASNMKTLLGRLNHAQRKAVRDEEHSRNDKRFTRAKDRFLRDHPNSAKKYEASQFIRDVEGLLDESIASDEIRYALARLSRQFNLAEEPTADIDNYAKFVELLKDIAYAPLRWSQETNGEEEGTDDAKPSAAIASPEVTAPSAS